MVDQTLLTGQLLTFSGDPFAMPLEDCVHHERSGGVLINGPHIAATGTADALRAMAPTARVVSCGDHLILPGFVDAHAHYPQTGMIASWGKRLIDWLNTYTFPEEIRLNDPDHAQHIAGRYLDLLLDHGTTTVASFCTSAPHSVDALFAAAQDRDMAIVAGKTCMDRHAPAALLDTATRAYDESKALIARWHGTGRGQYAISPRFAPTSTPDQLAALGALWAETPDCLMQTHLSEQQDECAWVAQLYPQMRDYLDCYEAHGLIGPKALFGHAIWLTQREKDRLLESGSGLVHCPTSNTFIGSGLFDMAARKAEGQLVGLATDTGGGSSFSMLRTMAAAYEIGQLAGTALHPAQLLWLATEGSARTLHRHDEIGTLKVGTAADLVVLDLASTTAISQRVAAAKDIYDAVFPTIMMGDDRAVAQVWVKGVERRAKK